MCVCVCVCVCVCLCVCVFIAHIMCIVQLQVVTKRRRIGGGIDKQQQQQQQEQLDLTPPEKDVEEVMSNHSGHELLDMLDDTG